MHEKGQYADILELKTIQMFERKNGEIFHLAHWHEPARSSLFLFGVAYSIHNRWVWDAALTSSKEEMERNSISLRSKPYMNLREEVGAQYDEMKKKYA